MKTNILNYYEKLYINQIRLKFLKKNIYYLTTINSVELSSSFTKLESLKTVALLELFYYFKLISNKKAFVSFFKKKYKEVDVSLKLNILRKSADFFFILFTTIFIPITLKKEIALKVSCLNQKHFNLTINSYNFYPFIPNIYFS